MSRRIAILSDMRDQMHRETDRMFGKLLIAQWVFAIVLALLISPYSYTAAGRSIHIHVKAAVAFGFIINALPLALIYTRPGWWGTRQVVAVVQMLWSALLIMITGGRIETHFHVFGSLAFLAFYRDWKLLPTATVVVAADHLARGLVWPDSVYGTLDPEWWRFLEHAGWVVFEDIVLAFGCIRASRDMRAAAARESRLADTTAATEKQVVERTAELQTSVERYRALVENTAAIPFELDAQTLRIIYIAPQAAQLYECSVAELARMGFFLDMVHRDDEERVKAWLVEVASSRVQGDTIDYRLVLRSGRTLYLRTLLSTRDPRHLRGLTIDMTRQRALEAELQQAQKLESVGRLAAGVAHEINTPVQFVSDSLTFIREAVTEIVEAHAATIDPYIATEVPLAIDRAAEGLDRVAVIVRSMKVFAHSTGERTATDLNQAIQSTLVIARNEYKYVADVETDLGDLPLVWCQGGEINQVLLNLLLNAAHAVGDAVAGTKRRGAIKVSTRVEGDQVVIAVNDNGTGIPESARDRVFDPFFTTKPVGKGTGQGLSIARSVVVERHQGTLTFDSAVGVGTTFFVRIPTGAHAMAERAA